MAAQTVHVELAERSYDVLVGFDWLGELGRRLKDRRLVQDNVAVITSPRIGALYYERVEAGLHEAGIEHVGRWDLPDGEEHKTLDGFCGAVRWLAQFAPDPAIRPAVVALGGGVVGDLAGFAAASFRRGVPYIQTPTTLLACVDSSVGGKTAVNLPEGKNLVGAFYQPRLVFMDLAALETLEARQVRSGAAEVIKHGAALDAGLFDYLEGNIEDLLALDRDVLARVVPWNVEIKARVVQEDERESRRVRICLNFGHTLGHAVERASDGALLHGECVAVGMIAAADISQRLGLCGEDVPERLRAVLRRAGLPERAEGVSIGRVMELMRHDKKFIAGRNVFILLKDIGQWTTREGVPMAVVEEAARAVIG